MQNSDSNSFPMISTQTSPNEYRGLTKREYFAGLAMQGLLASERPDFKSTKKMCAESAVEMADMLLNQLGE